MSDPRYTDPRLSDPPLSDDPRRAERLGELESSNAMWGWIAGGIVLALLLVFIFGRGPNPSDTAATNMSNPPASTTGQAPRAPAPIATPQSRPAPATTPAPSVSGQSSQ